MASLRKHPKLLPPKRSPIITLDRTLLAAVVGLVGFGALQTGAVNIAANDTPTPGVAATMTASRQSADYTPIGSIEKVQEPQTVKDKDEDKSLLAPFGLRSKR